MTPAMLPVPLHRRVEDALGRWYSVCPRCGAHFLLAYGTRLSAAAVAHVRSHAVARKANEAS